LADDLDGSLCVAADHQRLRQVLLNLLANAVKYNHPGGSVAVAVERVGHRRLRIGVTDTGRGISEADQQRLFVPFERLDAARTGADGVGLGLSLSRLLVENMGGRMGLASTLGAGSTFWVELPETDLPVLVPEPEADGGVLRRRPYRRGRTVLYVEDLVANVQLVEQILKQRPSITFVPAMLGQLALDLAREHRPDLVLLDLNLPDMSGEELLRRLQADPATRDTPVIALSADATRATVERVRRAGVVGYLTKPVSVRELLDRVDAVLGDEPARDRIEVPDPGPGARP
jgi:CheY-like chemotaxis protein